MVSCGFSRVFLLGLIVSSFLVVGVCGEVVVVDWTEDDMYIGRMSWGNFLANCYREDYLGTSSNFQDVNVHIEFDFDKQVFSGHFTAASEMSSGTVPYSNSCEGEISGVIKKVHWGGGKWFWEWDGSASVSLHFNQRQRCIIEDEDYWNSREETIQVEADFSGRGWSEYNTTSVDLSWSDNGGGQQAVRRFALSFTTDQGLKHVPVPYPLDLDVDVQVPEEVSRDSSEVLFSIDASGEDVALVEEVAWQFSYWHGGEDWWVDEYVQEDLSPLIINKKILDDWVWYLNEYGEVVDGEKKLLMTGWLLVYEDHDENRVIEPIVFNFTLTSAHSTRFILDIPDQIDVYPTGKNSTSFILDHSGTEVTSAISFEIEGTPPEYLSIALETTSAQKASNSRIENKLIVELDTSKLSGTTLPTEHRITLKAKSSTKDGPVEDSKEITLKIKPVKWLILHYSASDTSPSLQTEDEKNIHEIITAFQETKTPQVGYNLLIDLQFDWYNVPHMKDNQFKIKTKTHLLKYYDNQLELVESKDTLDMSKGATLTEFIKKSKEITPYEKIILIITDHGKGVHGIVLDDHQCIKEETIMSIPELDKALEGHHVELLILEACRMGTIEVLYELRDKADYIISSQLDLPAMSFNYEKALTPLLKDPSKDTVYVGNPFITTFTVPINYAVSLIETAELDKVVKEVTQLATSLNKGFDNTPEGKLALVNVFDVSTNDLKCISENLIKFESLKDQDIKTVAEKVKTAVDSAVITHRSKIVGGHVYYKEGNRGFELINDGESTLETEDGTEKLGSYEYYGIDITQNRFLLSNDFTEKYEALEFSKKTNWLDVIKKYSSTKKSKIVVRKNQKGNNLYLRTLDSEGYVNGFDPESEYKNRIVLEYAQAEYYSYPNGTEIILLPPEAKEFTTHVWGGYMEEAEESYTLTYRLIVDDVVVAEETVENPITEYTEHSIPITISDDEITIGETSITQLEIPQEDDPVIDTVEQETDQSSGGGIPSFPLASIVLGISLILILSRKRM